MMLNKEFLIDLQIKTINVLTNSSSRTFTLSAFYQPGPNHFDFKTIHIPVINCALNSLDDKLRKCWIEISQELNSQKGNIFEITNNDRRDSFDQVSIVDCLLYGCYESYLKSHIDLSTRAHIDRLVESISIHADQILSWHSSSGNSHFLRAVMAPRIQLQNYKSFGPWQAYNPSWIEASLFAHFSGQSGQEGLARIMETLWFDYGPINLSSTESLLIQEAENLILAISLGLRMPLQLEDLELISHPWPFGPDRPNLFRLKFRPSWSNPSEASSIRFMAFALSGRLGGDPSTGELVTSDDKRRIDSWMQQLTKTPQAVFSLLTLQRGIWAILGSAQKNYPQRRSLAFSGIFDCLSGLEGLNSNCKPEKKGQRIQSKATFIDVWSKIWIQRNARNNKTKSILSKSPSVKLVLESLYALRSDIAHADPFYLEKNLATVKSNMEGKQFVENVDASSVGCMIAQATMELLDEFVDNPNLLENLFLGHKP